MFTLKTSKKVIWSYPYQGPCLDCKYYYETVRLRLKVPEFTEL